MPRLLVIAMCVAGAVAQHEVEDQFHEADRLVPEAELAAEAAAATKWKLTVSPYTEIKTPAGYVRREQGMNSYCGVVSTALNEDTVATRITIDECAEHCTFHKACNYFAYFDDKGCLLHKDCAAGQTHSWAVSSQVYKKNFLPHCAEPNWKDQPGKSSPQAGWTRMLGGAQDGFGNTGAYGVFSSPPGYAYHAGPSQPCTHGHMWAMDDARVCNKASGATCPCNYGECPADFHSSYNWRNPDGWHKYGSRRRYSYPAGDYYPYKCPCNRYRCPNANYYVSGRKCVQCPTDHARTYHNGQIVFLKPWTYQYSKQYRDELLAVVQDDVRGGDTQCVRYRCPNANHYVLDGQCVPCPKGYAWEHACKRDPAMHDGRHWCGCRSTMRCTSYNGRGQGGKRMRCGDM